MVGRPRDQTAQRAPPHYSPGCHHHCSCQGPPGAGGGSGVRGCGWHHGVHGMKAAGQGQGSGPGLGCGYGVSWTCQDWGYGTWVRAAPGYCHPPPPSWYLSDRCCCWPTPRQAERSGGRGRLLTGVPHSPTSHRRHPGTTPALPISRPRKVRLLAGDHGVECGGCGI